MKTVSLQQIIDDSIDNKLKELHTCMPAQVVTVDVTKSQCSVKPLLKRKYADKTVVELPVINNVPIAFYRAGKAYISLPVKVGDLVELRFSERSLDIWLTSGGTVDPLDGRKHHLSDAIAYPGVYPFNDPTTDASADDIVIKNDASIITIKSDGKYLIEGESEELMDLLVQLSNKVKEIANVLSTATTNTIYGPMMLNQFAQFVTLDTQIGQIKDKIEEMKG